MGIDFEPVMNREVQPGPPLISVIIVNHNGREDLERCLHSLRDACGTRTEIIVVDNASTDGSAEYLDRLFTEVRLIRSRVNMGFGAGNNLGARIAKGQYLAFLNPDTLVEPGWLAALLDALQSDDQVGLVTSRILLLQDPGRVNACGNEIHLSGLTLCRGMNARREQYDQPAEVGAVSGAAFLIRRDVFEVLGGFDEDFHLYVEDTDLSWRARLAGYRCLYIPDSVVYHDYTLRFGPLKTFYQERNRYLMLLKNMRWRTLFVLLPALLLAEIVTWGFILIHEKGQWKGKLRAYSWIAGHWNQIMEKRQHTQALRKCSDRQLIKTHVVRLAYEQTGARFASALARSIFDPLFRLAGRATLAVISW